MPFVVSILHLLNIQPGHKSFYISTSKRTVSAVSTAPTTALIAVMGASKLAEVVPVAVAAISSHTAVPATTFASLEIVDWTFAAVPQQLF